MEKRSVSQSDTARRSVCVFSVPSSTSRNSASTFQLGHIWPSASEHTVSGWGLSTCELWRYRQRSQHSYPEFLGRTPSASNAECVFESIRLYTNAVCTASSRSDNVHGWYCTSGNVRNSSCAARYAPEWRTVSADGISDEYGNAPADAAANGRECERATGRWFFRVRRALVP